MPHVVTENCNNCRFTDCVTVCPVACFHGDDERTYIDPATCVDCAACVPVCPVHAISESADLAQRRQSRSLATFWALKSTEGRGRYLPVPNRGCVGRGFDFEMSLSLAPINFPVAVTASQSAFRS